MANVTVSPATGHINLSPTLFHVYAKQYLECERSFTTEAKFSPVPYFLICRSIELELKARHLETKSRLEVKTKYGHNLTRSYNQLPTTDKILTADEFAVLEHASKIYDIPNKGFEYVTVGDAVTGLRNFPDIRILKRIVLKLLRQ